MQLTSLFVSLSLIFLFQSVNGQANMTILTSLEVSTTGPQGYNFSYNLTDGQQRNETGFIKSVLNANGQVVHVIIVTGYFVFVGTNGKLYRVVYTADETGFHPSIQALPVDSQPIDPNCLKSLCG